MTMKRVLVVDDSRAIQRLVEVCLTQLEINVFVASTGAEARDLLESDAPDMLILDVGLPDTTGWKILGWVRTHEQLADMPVVMMTGYSQAERVGEFATRGPDGYLLKPFKPEDLRRIVFDTIHGVSSGAV